MSSSAGKIPTSTWEQNKYLIVELYRSRPLKDVRAVMQSQHGFEACSWEYEAQLKRWNIRKNATRKEWQQYFAADGDRSTTVQGETGSNLPSVILGKSRASKKRARRWASGGLTGSIPCHASRSTPPAIRPCRLSMFVPGEPHRPESLMEADIPDTALLTASSSTEFQNSPLRIGHFSSSMLPPYDAMAQSVTSKALFGNTHELAQLMDLIPTPLHAFSPSVGSDSLSTFLGHDSPSRAIFTSLGMPAENNMTFFSMLEDSISRLELPSTQLEQIWRSKGVSLSQASSNTMLGGLAAQFVAGILSSTGQSMTRRIAHLKRFLQKLGSQVSGETSALIADDQAFETKFARALIFSVLNGFAGLNDVPMCNILRFLNRFAVNNLLLEILEQCPRYVSRTLADNIFRAAIEAADTQVLSLLLSRKLVSVNDTVHVHGEIYTPIKRAVILRSPKLVRLLIDAGADVKGCPEVLINNIKNYLSGDALSTTPVEPYETLNVLFSAGAQVHPRVMIMLWDTMSRVARTMELGFLICQNIDPESHQDFFQDEAGQHGSFAPVIYTVRELDDYHAAKSIQKVVDLCHQSKCSNCLARSSHILRDAAISAASTGKLETIQLLLDKFYLKAELSPIFRAAIKSGSRPMIDFILSLGPELNPPALKEVVYFQDFISLSTPIAEALRYGNFDLMREFERSGCLEHVHEGDRFGALVQAAAEAGNVAYMRHLLARAVTSNESYRDSGSALALALLQGHRDIVQMLSKQVPLLQGCALAFEI